MNEHEALRKALYWLLQQPGIDGNRIAEASRHFDLSPLDEEFLVQYFLHRGHEHGAAPPKKSPD